MRSLHRYMAIALLTWTSSMLMVQLAEAHLMVAQHDLTGEPCSQLTVIGRFTLNDPDSALRFHIGLYGRQAAEQSLEITATRKRDNQKTVFELTSTAPASVIFPVSALPRQKPVAWHL